MNSRFRPRVVEAGSRESDSASLAVEELLGCVLVRVHRELDVVAAPGLCEAVEVVTEFSPRVIVDLTSATILDSVGLQALVQARRRAHDRGGRVALVGPTGVVLNALTVTGLDEVFPVFDELSTAISALTDVAKEKSLGRQ